MAVNPPGNSFSDNDAFKEYVEVDQLYWLAATIHGKAFCFVLFSKEVPYNL